MNIIQCCTILLLIAVSITLKGMEGQEKKLLSYEEFLEESSKLQSQIKPIKITHFIYSRTETDINFHLFIKSKIAEMALRTQMSNDQKLNYIIDDNLWKHRKTIITDMIENEKIHPNHITYVCITPLEECVVYNDIPFAEYLLQQGATVTSRLLKESRSQEMLELLQKHIHNEAKS